VKIGGYFFTDIVDHLSRRHIKYRAVSCKLFKMVQFLAQLVFTGMSTPYAGLSLELQLQLTLKEDLVVTKCSHNNEPKLISSLYKLQSALGYVEIIRTRSHKTGSTEHNRQPSYVDRHIGELG